MTYDPSIHHRRPIRLPAYDYTQPGAYFVTICTQDRQCLLGEIVDAVMITNRAGQGIDRWWNELNHKFSSVTTDAFVTMPNHVHGILVVGADLRVRPGASDSLPKVVQWFKTMTTNAYIRGVKEEDWLPFRARLWQRNYFEHIIRDEQEMDRIREYIIDNPSSWENSDDWQMIHPLLFQPKGNNAKIVSSKSGNR